MADDSPEPRARVARPNGMCRRHLLLVAALVLALSACGGEPAPRAADPAPSSPAVTDPANPPRYRVMVDGEEVPVFQGSYCWTSDGAGMCVDGPGPRPGDLVDVGSPESVELVLPGVPLERLTAALTPLEKGPCPRSYETVPTDLGDGRYRLDPAGPPGTYQVDLWGTAEQGEVPGAFRWTTPVAGPVGEPESRLGIVWQPHGEVEGQGFLLTVEDLPVTPTSASVTVTATAANGESLTFDGGKADLGCPASGYLFFSESGEGRTSDRVAALGPVPFTYEVDLVLDGESYRGTGTYPEPVDTDPDNDNDAPVLLEFSPPLPTG